MNEEPKNPAKIVDDSAIANLPMRGGIEEDENGNLGFQIPPEAGAVDF